MDRAAELFSKRGFAASSISDVALACNCSKSRLYHYFESKESILYYMLAEHIDHLIAGAKKILSEEAGEPAQCFRHLIRFFMDVYAVSREKHIVLLTCIEFLEEEKKQEIIGKQRDLVRYVYDILMKIRPDLAKDRSASHADTMLFFGMINWTYTWYDKNGAIASKELADRAIDIFLGGYEHFGKRDDQPRRRKGMIAVR
jgi:AcrR family transcriptional regulator